MARKKKPAAPDRSDFMEAQADIANALTELWGMVNGVQVWVKTAEEEHYTDEAQEVFNNYYDLAESLIIEEVGPFPED